MVDTGLNGFDVVLLIVALALITCNYLYEKGGS